MNCRSCKEELELEKFYFRKDTKKYHPECKKCHNKNSLQRKKNGLVKKRVKFNFICRKCQTQKSPEDFYLKNKKTNRHDTTCKECRKKETRGWHVDNRQVSLKNKREWHKHNRENVLVKMKENYRKRMEEDPKKEYEDRKMWRLENKDKINARARYRYATDINFKLRSRLHENCSRIIKRGCKKNCKTLRMLGCSVTFVRDWLESQFTPQMSWDNHGKFWHIDHFYPVACYDLSDPEEQNKCFHWSNLRPFPGRMNLSKGCKMPSEQEQIQHENKIVEYENPKEEKSITPVTKGSVTG